MFGVDGWKRKWSKWSEWLLLFSFKLLWLRFCVNKLIVKYIFSVWKISWCESFSSPIKAIKVMNRRRGKKKETKKQILNKWNGGYRSERSYLKKKKKELVLVDTGSCKRIHTKYSIPLSAYSHLPSKIFKHFNSRFSGKHMIKKVISGYRFL